MLTAEDRPAVSTFILKVASRCNLACDYCYMYTHADQSWRTQPAVMSHETASRFVDRLRRYIEETNIPSVSILLHGGEPLLIGEKLLEYILRMLRSELPPWCRVDISLQTNATLLTPDLVNLLGTWDVGISVSLDGDQLANDRHRLTHGAHSSYHDVVRGIDHVRNHPLGNRLFSGILGVIDLRNEPVDTFEHIVSLGAPSADFLLPDGTYGFLPPGMNHPGVREGSAPYGKWLARLFDHWYGAPGSKVGIRLFENIMDVCLGGLSRTEGVGFGYFSILTIETSGEIQDVDVLKVAFPGAPRLGSGYSVHLHDFTEVLSSEEVLRRTSLVGQAGLCDTCQECPIVRECGGGHLPHRFRLENAFDNPSIYCGDLWYLINHVRSQLNRDLKVITEG